MLENLCMNCSKNEEYLLKFISKDVSEKDDEMLSFLLNNGIKLKLTNTNSVYQIIDELYFSEYINKTVG